MNRPYAAAVIFGYYCALASAAYWFELYAVGAWGAILPIVAANMFSKDTSRRASAWKVHSTAAEIVFYAALIVGVLLLVSGSPVVGFWEHPGALPLFALVSGLPFGILYLATHAIQVLSASSRESRHERNHR